MHLSWGCLLLLIKKMQIISIMVETKLYFSHSHINVCTQCDILYKIVSPPPPIPHPHTPPPKCVGFRRPPAQRTGCTHSVILCLPGSLPEQEHRQGVGKTRFKVTQKDDFSILNPNLNPVVINFSVYQINIEINKKYSLLKVISLKEKNLI